MESTDDKKRAKSEINFEDIDALIDGEAKTDPDFDEHINKSLSMVLHHADIKNMIAIIRKVHRERINKNL